jgi:predicted phage gp36 major capsid-like protein
MTEHDDRQGHEAKADELERELDDMQERSERLGGDIEGAGEDWEQQKKDESVPGATDDLDDEADGEDGGGEVDAEELDFGRDIGTEAVVAEDGPPSEEDDDDDEDEDDSDEDDSDDDED